MAKTPESKTERESFFNNVRKLIIQDVIIQLQGLLKDFDGVIFGELIDMVEFIAELTIKLTDKRISEYEKGMIEEVVIAINEVFDMSNNPTPPLQYVIFNRPNMFTLIVTDSLHYYSFDDVNC